MTKFKVIVQVEKAGEVIATTAPVFVFGIDEDRPGDGLVMLADAIVVELVGALQTGMRQHAGLRGIKVWPQEG